MAKKKKDLPAAGKVVLFVEIDAELKADMERLAKANERKLTGEVVTALRRYVAAETATYSPATGPRPSA